MRDGLAAETTEERDAIVLNVTEHNTENNCSVITTSFYEPKML